MDFNGDEKKKKILLIAGTVVVGLGVIGATVGLGPMGASIQSGLASAQASASVYATQAYAYFQSLGPLGYAYASAAATSAGVLIAYGKDILNWIKEQIQKARNKLGI